MLNENKFVDEVWNKYKDYLQKDSKNMEFYNKKIYRNNNYLLAIKTCSIFIVCTFLIIGGVYAGIKVTNKKQEVEQEDVNLQEVFDDYKDMTFVQSERIYYKKISTYQEYRKYKEKYNNFTDMQEDEFEDYDFVIFGGRTSDRIGLYVHSMSIADNEVNIVIGRDIEKNNQFVSIKIRKENSEKKIKITFSETVPNMQSYVPMKDLPYVYEEEQAIKDNCVVIEMGNIQNGEKDKIIARENELKEFIEKKLENNCIRIVYYYNNIDSDLDIVDIEYKDEKYIVAVHPIRYDSSMYQYSEFENASQAYYYFVSDKFETVELKDSIKYKLYESPGLEWGFEVEK